MAERRSKWAVALVIFWVLALSTGASAQGLRKIKFATAPSLEGDLPVIVAQEKGYFAKEGLDFEFVVLGGPLTRAAVASGDATFGNFHVALMWTAVRAGLPIKFIANYYTRESFSVVVSQKASDIKSIADLKGHAVFSSLPGSASYAAAAFLLHSGGLDIGKDVQLVNTSTPDPRVWLNALDTSKVDALVGCWQPITGVALQHGNRSLVDLGDPAQADKLIGGEVVTNGIGANEKTINDDPELIHKVLDATTLALQYIQTASPEDMTAIAQKSIYASLDKDLLLQILTKEKGNFKADTRPSVSGYERATKVYLTAGFLKEPIPFDQTMAAVAGKDP